MYSNQKGNTSNFITTVDSLDYLDDLSQDDPPHLLLTNDLI